MFTKAVYVRPEPEPKDVHRLVPAKPRPLTLPERQRLERNLKTLGLPPLAQIAPYAAPADVVRVVAPRRIRQPWEPRPSRRAA